MDENLGIKWPVKAVKPPKLSGRDWIIAHIAGVVLLALAVGQLLQPSPAPKVVVLAFMEIWGGLSLFKINLSKGFRRVGNLLAIVSSLLWIILSFTDPLTYGYSSWVVAEATVLTVAVLYTVNAMIKKSIRR